ncbi:hypothetical protein IWZ03DRAFT_363114 [Phyllosticta citriasiana]|uniref:Uncharacterized protein n=1 Tax=Phyllosticta citriasiana TaxID=595635 RepID=A0ABR1KCJ8_9PEZI
MCSSHFARYGTRKELLSSPSHQTSSVREKIQSGFDQKFLQTSSPSTAAVRSFILDRMLDFQGVAVDIIFWKRIYSLRGEGHVLESTIQAADLLEVSLYRRSTSKVYSISGVFLAIQFAYHIKVFLLAALQSSRKFSSQSFHGSRVEPRGTGIRDFLLTGRSRWVRKQWNCLS